MTAAWNPDDGLELAGTQPERHKDNLLELARQLLPLGSAREAARDGLLCVAGIQGIGAGAVLWRDDDSGPFVLLSHFGLSPGRSRARYRLPLEAQSYLLEAGAVTLDTARRRGAGRELQRALRPLDAQLGEAWVVPLHVEGKLRGLFLAGPSLVTQQLIPPSDLPAFLDLAELLRLRLLGCAGEVAAGPGAARMPPSRREVETPQVAGRSASARLRALRRTHPETAVMVGESAALLALLEEIVTLADTGYTVLVEGDTGTGKELAAQLLHRLSRRKGGAFETVDCSAIPQELIESELFGHVKGAFTGASRDFRGAFERADGGTLLLDEIGDMDLRSQTRLLRVLQEGQVRRLGGDRAVPVDVRVVAATNRDLAELVRQGRFRADLYYRIHVCPLRVPSVQERGEDRLVLFEHFMAQHAAELSRPLRRLRPAARRRLRGEAFPGNVRQLQNVVRQLLVQRDRRGAVEEAELERVLQRASNPPVPATASEPRREEAARPEGEPAGPARRDGESTRSGRQASAGQDAVAAAAPALDSGSVEDVGLWVLARLREHRFNLSAAARQLEDLRRGGTSRLQIPVFDRGALDYYLCGEFFRHLNQKSFDLDAAVRAVAARAPLEARVRRKVLAYLRPLRGLARKPAAQAKLQLRDAYRRVPEGYQGEIEKAAGALRRGRWRLP